MHDRTPGEQVLEKYLQEQGILYRPLKRQPPAKTADYIIRPSAGKLLAEVKDIAVGPDDQTILDAAAAGVSVAGAWDPSYRVRETVREAVDQLETAKLRCPTVAVIYVEPGIRPFTHDLAVREALFGKLAIVQPVSRAGPVGTGWSEHRLKRLGKEKTDKEPYGVFHRERFAAISAVVILEEIKPHEGLRHQKLAELKLEGDKAERGFAGLAERLKNNLDKFAEIEEELVRTHGAGFVDQLVPRVRVYHNPNASVPLPHGSFSGPYDVHLAVGSDAQLLVHNAHWLYPDHASDEI